MDINFKLTMIEIIAYIIIVIVMVMWCYIKWHNRPFEKLAAIMPGPPAYPIVGTAYQFIGLTPERKKNNKLPKNDYNMFHQYIFVDVLQRS